MKDWVFKILCGLFAVVLILSMIGMLFGPLGYEQFSVTMCGAACVLAVLGIAAALRCWKLKE